MRPKRSILYYAMLAWFTFIGVCVAAPPDAFVRMESPKVCTGGVFYDNGNFGLIATCRHCTAGDSATFRFFKDGYSSPRISARLLATHPTQDVAIFSFDSRSFAEHPVVTPLATSADGPFVGQTVYSVGTNASGTVAPAVQKTHITSVSDGAYELKLEEGAWGGHSGGPIITEDGKLIGNLYATQYGRPGISVVTGVPAIYEALSNVPTPQAFMSVPPEFLTASKRVVSVRITGTHTDIAGIMSDVQADPWLAQNVDWDDSPIVGALYNKPVVTWHYGGQKWILSDGWQGAADFRSRLKGTGVPVPEPSQCPPGGCPPGQYQPNPNSWWFQQQPQPQQVVNDDRLDKLIELAEKREAREAAIVEFGKAHKDELDVVVQTLNAKIESLKEDQKGGDSSLLPTVLAALKTIGPDVAAALLPKLEQRATENGHEVTAALLARLEGRLNADKQPSMSPAPADTPPSSDDTDENYVELNGNEAVLGGGLLAALGTLIYNFAAGRSKDRLSAVATANPAAGAGLFVAKELVDHLHVVDKLKGLVGGGSAEE